MKTPLFMLGAAALSLLAGAASASPDRAVQAFLTSAQAQAEQRLVASGFNLDAQAVQVRAAVSADGRLSAVHVIRSTGSRDGDFGVEQALKTLRLNDVPAALIGANLTLALGHGGPTLAKTP